MRSDELQHSALADYPHCLFALELYHKPAKPDIHTVAGICCAGSAALM